MSTISNNIYILNLLSITRLLHTYPVSPANYHTYSCLQLPNSYSSNLILSNLNITLYSSYYFLIVIANILNTSTN